MMEKIDIKEVERNIPSGVAIKVRALDASNNMIVCDPRSLSSLRKIEYGEHEPVNGDYVSAFGLGTFSVDSYGEGNGFQFRLNEDNGTPVFQIRVFINASSQWSNWKSVTLT